MCRLCHLLERLNAYCAGDKCAVSVYPTENLAKQSLFVKFLRTEEVRRAPQPLLTGVSSGVILHAWSGPGVWVCAHCCLSTMERHAERGAAQENVKRVLRYHWNATDVANREWILQRKGQRSSYDRPYPAVAGSVGHQVQCQHPLECPGHSPP